MPGKRRGTGGSTGALPAPPPYVPPGGGGPLNIPPPPAGGSTGSTSATGPVYVFHDSAGIGYTQYEYNSLARSYNDIARAYGYNLSTAQMHSLAANDVSPTEFQQRIVDVQTLRANKTYFDQFENVLRERGLSQKFGTSDRLNFITGKSPNAFYSVWEEAAVRGAASGAGLGAVNRYTGGVGGAGDTTFTGKQLRGIYGFIPAGQQLSQADLQSLQTAFADLAMKARQVLPEARLQDWGLSKQDLLTLEFGGANQASIAQRVNQILNSQKAEAQAPASAGYGFATTQAGGTQPASGLTGLSGGESSA